MRNSTNTPDLHVNFQLSKSGEAIGLFAPDGRPIDTVTFGPQTNNISQGRLPDGSAEVHFLSRPTPRAANAPDSAATAPVFTKIELLATGDLNLTWRTISGKTYRLEYKTDLRDLAWSTVGDYPATGSSLSVPDRIGVTPQRIYRVGQLEQ